MYSGGWSNFQTWAVYTNLTNDERSHRQAVDAARSGAGAVRRLVEDMVELLDHSPLAADLLSSALDEVDWDEVTRALVDDVILPEP